MDKETEDKIMKATDIMHPEDAKAIQMIKSVPGCEQLIRVFMKLGYEAQYRGENLANHIKVTLKSFSEIYRLFKEVVARVGIREPELYIYNDPEINAYTYGETNTFVAISSGAVERMNKDELKGILAHECGHILCKHTLYMTIWGEGH
jgi:Zn-dependent protease with chaperone function